MPDAPLGTVLRHVRKLAAAPPGAGPSDRDLLREFAAGRDAGAFAALVRRHGPAVLGVCRRVLHHAEDAEDAFQATFLTLARKAHAIRKAEALGCWLHGVAYRMAMKAKRDAARRRRREGQARPAPPANPSWDAAWREVQALLEAEIQRLPERYRAPFVLCCLEGHSRAEAAQALGVKEGTVWSRLAEARKRLQERLSRRGVTLAGALGAAALGPAGAQAGLPPALVKATAEAAARCGAGEGGAAAVLGGVTRTMFATKCRAATTVLLALVLAAGAGVLALRAPAAAPPAAPPAPPPPAKAERPAEQPKPAAIDNDKGDTVTVAGRVLGPDGKPFAGAEITAWWHSHHGWVAWQNSRMHSARPKLLGRSGPDGRFRFTFPKAEIKDSLLNSDAQPWRLVNVIAAAPGHGPAWSYAEAVSKGELSLRLVQDDVPIRGRVRDLEGRPVAGASVEVALAADLEVRSWAGLLGKITTDKDGRFTLTGVGRGRSVRLLITGPAIEFKVLDVTTPAEKDGKPAAPVAVDVVVGPTKVITGTVRALDTGKPLAGVWVYGHEHHYCNTYVVRPVRAMTDKDGRYRLVGLPKAKMYELRAYPAAGQNYLVRDRTVADTEGLKPLRADFELRHGVPIAFRLIEKETGRPVRGHVQYEPTSDNPYRSEAVYAPGVIPAREFMRLRETGADGYVRFVAYPGPCVIFAHAGRGSPPYLHGRLDPADRAKGYFPGPRGDPSNGFLEITNGYARIDYKATDEEQKFDIFFYRGPYLKGRLLGPGDRPVTGATAFGLTRDASAPRPDTHPADEALKTEVFTALGLYPKERRTLSFIHKEDKLVGYVVVDGTEERPVEVRLQPWGAVTGRLVDGAGKPLAGVKVRRFYPALPAPGMRANGEEFVTDAAGRFRVEGLLPEQKHQLALAGPKEGVKLDAGAALKDLSAPAGRVKDLGEVRVQVQTVPTKKK